MTYRVQAAVIGAGVVGLAVARELARRGLEVVVLEKAACIGSGISARNSEVIHAGIYYPEGSLKAKFCVEGKQLLYSYCREHGVPHKRCGKLIVATSQSEIPQLGMIKSLAEKNRVLDLEFLQPSDVSVLEPEISCKAALLSPSTGIVDSHALMLALQGDAEEAGAAFAFCSPVVRGEIGRFANNTGKAANVVLHVGGDTDAELQAQFVVNCAGLSAPSVASTIGVAHASACSSWMAKGNYYRLQGRGPFSHLVYPVPVPGGLGVHATIDLAGQTRFGPDVEWVDTEDYSVDPERADAFYEQVRRYWPGLSDGALESDYAGIRPKIVGPGEPAADFLIQGQDIHGVDGLWNLFGIESPGLTSCLALSKHVGKILAKSTS